MTENQKRLERALLTRIEETCQSIEPTGVAEMSAVLVDLWRLADEQEENRINSERYTSGFNL